MTRTRSRRVRLGQLLLIYWRLLNFELHLLHAALSRSAASASGLVFIFYLYLGVLMWTVYWALYACMIVIFVLSFPIHRLKVTVVDRTVE
jgi:hypothetical protein